MPTGSWSQTHLANEPTTIQTIRPLPCETTGGMSLNFLAQTELDILKTDELWQAQASQKYEPKLAKAFHAS